MNKKILAFLLIFVLFIPKVNAFSYEMKMNVDSTNVTSGSTKEIKVSLENISGLESGGIGYCSLNISFDNNILLDSKIRSLGSWTMTQGDIYAFDTLDFVNDRSDLFVIPVKVNGNGSVLISNIVCTDGNTNVNFADQSVDFTVVKTEVSNPSDTPSDSKSSNCDLSSLTVSEGTIEFDPSITEYTITVDDIDNFTVDAMLADENASYVIDKNILESGKSYVITVTAEDGSTKVYTLNIKTNQVSDAVKAKKVDYTPIFIGIIVVLVLINVFRIVKNKKK